LLNIKLIKGGVLKKRNLLVTAGAAAVIGVTGLTSLGVASAATSSSTDGTSSLVDKIAKKFNLNASEVEAVFTQDRAEHQEARKQQVTDKLTQAVKDGKITEDQKQKILAKITEMQTARDANRAAMKDKTEAERKAAMDAKKTELESWAKENNIPTDYLRYVGGKGGPGGRLGGGPPPTSATN
jgi:hypothetical protein